jgi:hypothetical protein
MVQVRRIRQAASDADSTNPVLSLAAVAVEIPGIENAGQRDNSQLAESRRNLRCVRCVQFAEV